jgi:hypothetical protein
MQDHNATISMHIPRPLVRLRSRALRIACWVRPAIINHRNNKRLQQPNHDKAATALSITVADGGKGRLLTNMGKMMGRFTWDAISRMTCKGGIRRIWQEGTTNTCIRCEHKEHMRLETTAGPLEIAWPLKLNEQCGTQRWHMYEQHQQSQNNICKPPPSQ